MKGNTNGFKKGIKVQLGKHWKIKDTSKMRGHHRSTPSNRKGKSYKEIYGDKAQLEINKRRMSHVKFWDKKGRNPQNRDKHVGTDYIKWRTAVFQKDNWTCQTCQIKGGYLESHHIKSWFKYPALRFEVINGITLCRKPCHILANKEQRKIEMGFYGRVVDEKELDELYKDAGFEEFEEMV